MTGGDPCSHFQGPPEGNGIPALTVSRQMLRSEEKEASVGEGLDWRGLVLWSGGVGQCKHS